MIIIFLSLYLSTSLIFGAQRPNIIVIVMDDLGYSDVGYNGGDIPTPFIDELALNGIRLNYNYVEPACSPTRSSLLSGLYSYKTGLNDVIVVPNAAAVDDSIKFISDALNENNYNTLLAGKWHIGGTTQSQLPYSRGFQQSLYVKNGYITYYDHDICFNWNLIVYDGLISEELQTPPDSFTISQLFSASQDGYCGYDLWYDADNTYLSNDDGSYIEDILSDRVFSFINEYDRSKQRNRNPFFIWYAMITPHTPLIIPPQTSSICNNMNATSERIKACNAIYYADKLIGDLVTKLKDLKLYDDTVIIFLSDNGAQPLFPILNGGAGNPLPLRGCKGSPFESGIRTAAILSGGYIKNKYRNCDYNNIIHASDYYAIIASLGNIDKTMDTNLNEIDGINLLPNIYQQCDNNPTKGKKKTISRDEFISFRYSETTQIFERAIIRNNSYKLVINPILLQFPPQFIQAFQFIQHYVPYDTQYTILPDDSSYSSFNSFDIANNNNKVYYSKCYEDGNINVYPYIDNISYPNHEIYLFDIENDNIEACNIAADNVDIVEELINKLLSELPSLNGGGGPVTTTPDSKGSILAGIDAYNCDTGKTSYVTWADKPQYQDIEEDWNTIFVSYLDKIAECASVLTLNSNHYFDSYPVKDVNLNNTDLYLIYIMGVLLIINVVLISYYNCCRRVINKKQTYNEAWNVFIYPRHSAWNVPEPTIN